MKMSTSIAHIFFRYWFLTGIYSTYATIIGVPIEKLSFYDSSQEFSCLDGSQSIPFVYVNDNYCDCSDGSDEPGTSACEKNKFYCENRDHEPQYLLSSRVNDGICDCCDGMDEWDTDVACPNTCIELGRKIKEELKRLEEVEELGYKKRSEYINQGRLKKEECENTLSTIENDLGVVLSEIEVLRTAKEEAEEPESRKKEEHQQQWEEQKAILSEEKRRQEALKMFNTYDTDSNGELTIQEIVNRKELDGDNDGTIAVEEAEVYLDGNEPVGFEKFLEKSWDLISAKLKEFQTEEQEDIEERENEIEDDDDDNDGKPDDDEPLEMPPYDEETQKLIDTAESARQSLKDAEERKKKLESEKNDLEKYLYMGLGYDQEFSPLFEQCYEYTDREYTYKLCMFQKITQRTKSGGRETSLGTWDKWIGSDSNEYSSMRYGNGERCWNGPDRSTVVHLQCGIEDKIISASEPNKCEYAMEFITPAFCRGRIQANEAKPRFRVEL